MNAITDETLMALADGELEPAEAARVREALGRDADLAVRFASFAESRALLSRASAVRADESVPAQLIDAARRLGAALPRSGDAEAAAVVVPLASRLQAGSPHPRDTAGYQRFASFRPLALAASLAICIGGVAGFALRGLQESATIASALDDVAVAPEVAQLLSRLASGESRQIAAGSPGMAEVTMVATHRMDDGAVCRELTIAVPGASTQQTRVACLRDRSWRIQLVVVSPSAETFTPASGRETANHFIESLGSKGILTGEAERSALSRP